MENKTKIMNRKKNAFRTVTCVLLICSFVFVALVVIIALIRTKNLNGDVIIETVTVKEITSENQLISEKGATYLLNTLSEELEWESYVGKTLTLITPSEQFAADPWILGVIEGDNVLIDYNGVLADKLEENTVLLAVFSSICGIGILLSCVFYFLYSKNPATQTVELDEAIWSITSTNLPFLRKRNKLAVIFVMIPLILVLRVAVLGSLSEKYESESFDIAIGVSFSVAMLAFIILPIYVSLKYLPQKEIEFYKKNYPFNSDDVSHLVLKKSIKTKLQEDLKNERIKNPDKFYDFGNGFDANFTNDGLVLSCEDYDNEFEIETSGVFEEYDNPDAKNLLFEYKIPYDKLNLVAIQKYHKYANMFGIIIKTRLREEDAYPVEIHYDVYLLFDSNLQNTLKKYSLTVEGLDDILANLETLMKENCPKAKSGLNNNRFLG